MTTQTKILALMQREWLQHRRGWLLLLAIPLGLTLLGLLFGQVQIDSDDIEQAGAALPALLAMVAIAATTVVLFGIVACSSLVIVSGLARRDHADRSVEFWLSMPASHSASLGTPMLVHLLLVPAAAIGVGLLSGYVFSFLLVGRMAGYGAWLTLPWGTLLPASLGLALRLLAGLPLALLWISPLLLLVVLLSAWFRKWAWVILTVGLTAGGLLMQQLFGYPWINRIGSELLRQAGHALMHGDGSSMHLQHGGQAVDTLALLPAWALGDFVAALRELASPLLLGSLLFSAGCFFLLVQWRKSGSATAS